MTDPVETFWAGLRQERFLLVGVGGITGSSAARLFRRMGIRFKISDAHASDAATSLTSELGLEPHDVYLGPQLAAQLEGITQILVSPGVPRSLPLLRAAKARQIRIWCDFDLLYPLYAERRIAAITGTDGKTTTTSLVGHLLRPSYSVVVAGNIGTPICAVYDELMRSDVVVLELSSFMLEELVRSRANVATVLNIAEDHVDRYDSLVEYAEAKRNIVRYARPSDLFVQNLDDPQVSSWTFPDVGVRTISLNRRADVYLDQDDIRCGDQRLPVSQLQIRGKHLVGDVIAAISIATALGLPLEFAYSRAATFAGVPHRFEFVGQFNGIQIIDDSKATSVHAVTRALESLSAQSTVLILGGRDKSLDPAPLARYAAQLRGVVGYGEAGRRMVAAFNPALTQYRRCFDEAIRLACAMARPGDVVLLSPACTSFDQHRDYAERGSHFRQLVRDHLK